MARVNKFASVNLNDLFGKKEPSVKTAVNGAGSVVRPKGVSHGGMLVLTRPVKKQPVKIGAGISTNLTKEKSDSLTNPTESNTTELSKAAQIELKNGGTENSDPEPVQSLNNRGSYVPPSLRGPQTIPAPANVEVVTSEKTVPHGEEFPTLQASVVQANTNIQHQRTKDSRPKQIDLPTEELEKLQQLSMQAHQKNKSDGSADLDTGRLQPNRPQFFRPPQLRGEQHPVSGRPETTIERSLVRDNNMSDWIDDERTYGIGPRPGSANSYGRPGSANSFGRMGIDRRPNSGGYGDHDHIRSRPLQLAQSDYGPNVKDEQFQMSRLHENRSISRPPSRGGSGYEREALPRPGSGGSGYEKEVVYQPGRSRYEREQFPRPGSGGGENEKYARPGSGGGRRYEREMIHRPGSGGRRYQSEVEVMNTSGNVGENHEREVMYSPFNGDGMYEREVLSRPGSRGGRYYEREVVSRPGSGGGRYYEREAMGRPGSGGAYYPQQGFRGRNNGRPGSGGNCHEREVFGRPGSGDGNYRISQQRSGYAGHRGQHTYNGYEANRERENYGFKDNSFKPKGISSDRDDYSYGRGGAQNSTRNRESFRQVAGYGGSFRGSNDNGQRYDASATAYVGYDRYDRGSIAGGNPAENYYQNPGRDAMNIYAMENSKTFVNNVATGKAQQDNAPFE